MYIPRLAERAVERLSASFPVVLLTGARQVGKTTMLRHLASQQQQERAYVSLDDFAARSLALEDPGLFLQANPPPVIIDEVQHAPNLLAHLKPRADRADAMGGWWLTGSQHFPLMRGVSESLAGRVGIVTLMGMSTAEESEVEHPLLPFRPDRPTAGAGAATLPDVFDRIVRGGFPRLLHADAPPVGAWYDAYLQTYVERDVRSLMNIRNLADFSRFLRVAASRTGRLLNYSDIARDVGVTVNTIKDWLELLVATFQVHLLRPYFRNIGKRQTKNAKLYFVDPGLACHLVGWRSGRTASSGAMAGALFENHVVAQLLASYRHRGLEPPLWFWRDKEGHEVDVLIAEDGKLFAVEVKLSAAPDRKALAGMRAIERSGTQLAEGAVICLAQERMPLTRTVQVIPVSHL